MKSKIFTLSVFLLALTFYSCNKEENKEENKNIKINTSSPIFLKRGQTTQINAVSIKPLTYNAENEFHATVSNTGLITAYYVGKTKINLTNGSDKKSIQLIVEPEYNLYQTPNIEWGTSRSQIKNQYGTPDRETADVIIYENYSSAAPFLLFTFDKNDQVESYALLVKTMYVSTLGKFLAERYMYLGASGEYLVYLNGLTIDQATIMLGVLVYNLDYVAVLYVNSHNISKQAKKVVATSMDHYRNLLKNTIHI
ncbi:MAG: Ig-like domain-containing protein [Bacteroidales bacterium]